MDHQLADDALLDEYFLRNDDRYLGILLERYTLPLYGICYKYLRDEARAKDCVQTILVKLIRELPRKRPANLKGWLYRVACNEALLVIRKDKRHDIISLKENIDLPQADADDYGEVIWEKELTYLPKALEALPDAQRTCVRMFFMERKSYAEIAAETTYTMAQVKSHLQNGKRALKIILRRQHGRDAEK